jgi:hypothetical protein
MEVDDGCRRAFQDRLLQDVPVAETDDKVLAGGRRDLSRRMPDLAASCAEFAEQSRLLFGVAEEKHFGSWLLRAVDKSWLVLSLTAPIPN